MKIQMTIIAFATLFSATLAGSASAEVIAGWDFSSLPVAGGPVSVLAADVTGAGASGTLSVSGTATAGALAPGTRTTDEAGIQGGLTGGDTFAAPDEIFAFLTPGSTGFNGAGSQFLGLTTPGAASLQFEATGIPVGPSSNLRLALGGLSLPNNGIASDGTSTVDVSFGSTCGSTASVGSVDLNDVDRNIVFSLGTAASSTGCIVLEMDGSINQPLVDNITLSVPEPGVAGGLVAGLLGLCGLARRRG